MKIESEKLELDEDDLKKIFALFTSCTKYERDQVFDQSNSHYYKNNDLKDHYEVSMEKLDFAVDAWRAVISVLEREGAIIKLGDSVISLGFINKEFM